QALAQSSVYTNLYVPYNQSASLNVSTGQVARIVSARFPGGNGQLTITLGTNTFLYNAGDFAGTSAIGTAGPPTVAGPGTITIYSTSPGVACFCSVELTTPAVQLMPSTAVVIP